MIIAISYTIAMLFYI